MIVKTLVVKKPVVEDPVIEEPVIDEPEESDTGTPPKVGFSDSNTGFHVPSAEEVLTSLREVTQEEPTTPSEEDLTSEEDVDAVEATSDSESESSSSTTSGSPLSTNIWIAVVAVLLIALVGMFFAKRGA
jgi:cobalamin biosynthesis Mg chelatase CobN